MLRLTACILVAVVVCLASAPSAAAEHINVKFVTGYVEKTNGQAIRVAGTWYDLSRAAVRDGRNRLLRSQDVKMQAYVRMRLENDKVRSITVVQGLSR